jgi:hypothetical protein
VYVWVSHIFQNKQRLHIFPSPAFNRSVFVRETKCISCKIKTELLYYLAWTSFSKVMLWFRRLPAGLSPRKPVFDPETVHVWLWPIKWQWDRVFLPVLSSSPHSLIPTLLQTKLLMVLLQEEHAGEAKEPWTIQCFSYIGRQWTEKYFQIFSLDIVKIIRDMSRIIIGRPRAGWPTQSPLPAQQTISLSVCQPGHTKPPTQWVLGVKGLGREPDLFTPT